MPSRVRGLACALLIGAAVAACAPTLRERGQRLDEEALAAIQPGVTTAQEVARLLGSPSAVAPFDRNSWLYVRQRLAYRAFLRPRIEEQEVVVVRFNDDGVVRAVERRDLADGRPIEPVADETPTLGTQLSLWEQLIGNIGRFPAQPAPRPGAPLP